MALPKKQILENAILPDMNLNKNQVQPITSLMPTPLMQAPTGQGNFDRLNPSQTTRQNIMPANPVMSNFQVENPSERPQRQPNQTITQESQDFTPQILRDQMGNITGTKIGDKVIFGLPKDIKPLIENQIAERTAPQGSVEASDVAQQQAQRELGQQLAQGVGQTGILQEEPLTQLDFERAVKQGVASAGTSITAGVGATLLTGNPLLGVGTAVTLFLNAGVKDIKKQLDDPRVVATQTLTKAERNLRTLVSDTNAHPQNGNVNLALYNQQKQIILEQRNKLNRESQRDLSKFLSDDNTAERMKFEMFFSPGGSGELLDIQMREALRNPNPNKIILTTDELNEPIE